MKYVNLNWIILTVVCGVWLAVAGATMVSSSEAPDPRARPDAADSLHTLSQGDVRELVPGLPVERELAGREVHAYRVTLAAGQYLHVVVDQRGINVAVILFGPDGQQLAEMDSPNATQGLEPVSAVAEASGDYWLEVRALKEEAVPGRYEVKIEELRAATPQDRSRIAAERAFMEGHHLRAEGTAEPLRRAIEKCEEALPLWRAIGDRYGEAMTLISVEQAYDVLGEAQKGLDYLGQALPLFRAVGDRRGEAQVLNNIGYYYGWLGDNQKALDYYAQALPFWRAVGDRSWEATVLNNIGWAYDLLGEKQKALDYYGQAFQLRRARK